LHSQLLYIQDRIEAEDRRKSLEEQMDAMQLADTDKERYRDYLMKVEADDMRDQRKRLTTNDFEALALIGKGAFGEVRLVRMKERFSREIYAMKSMLKEAMIMKNQVGHVRAERDILTESENPWIVTLYYSFQVTLATRHVQPFYGFIYYVCSVLLSRIIGTCTW
jgi:serine/threonine protein kinase